MLAISSPAYAQLGGIVKKAQEAQARKQQFDDLNITEPEELQIGADVSAEGPPAVRRGAGRRGAPDT